MNIKKIVLTVLAVLIVGSQANAEYVLYKESQKDSKSIMLALDEKEHAEAYATLMHYQFPMSLCYNLKKELKPEELARLDADEEAFIQSKMPQGIKIKFVPTIVYETEGLEVMHHHLQSMLNRAKEIDGQGLGVKYSPLNYEEISRTYFKLLPRDVFKDIFKSAVTLRDYTFSIRNYYTAMKDLHADPTIRRFHYLTNNHLVAFLQNTPQIPNYDEPLKTIALREAWAHKNGHFLLFRGTNGLLDNSKIDSTLPKYKRAIAHSLSYGSSFKSAKIFDRGACPEFYIKDLKIGYTVAINKKAFRDKAWVYHMFFIPPIPTFINFYLWGECFHPRSKVTSRKITGFGFGAGMHEKFLLTDKKVFPNQETFEKAFQQYLAKNIRILNNEQPAGPNPAPAIKSKL